MQTPTPEDKVTKKCAAVMSKLLDSFPQLLVECEANEAAAIIADLIKAQLKRPVPEGDQEQEAIASLIAVIQQATGEEEE